MVLPILGIATAARTPRITIIITNSISVNPFFKIFFHDITFV